MDTLWTNGVSMPRFPTLDRDERADVLVVGGGIAGLLCAYRLQQLGLSVIVAEADRIGSGVTARTTAKLTTQHGGSFYGDLIAQYGDTYAREYHRAQEKAIAWFDDLSVRFPCDAETVDAYLYTRTDGDGLRREEEAIRRSGGRAESSDITLPFSCERVLHLPSQRQFHPLKLLRGVAEELTVYEHTRIQGLRDQLAVTDSGVTVFAQHIVVATHFPFVNRHGLYPIKLHQQRSYVLVLENASRLPGMLLDAAPNGIQLREYKQWLLLSGAGHRTGKPGEAWKPLEDAAAQWFPEATITHRWATQDCCTADGVAYIGDYGKHTPDWQVITGFNGWGMSGALVAADVTADTLTQKSGHSASLFAPSRRVPKLPLWDNARESVMGLLTPTVPRCTHLGCALHWNPWEHSWDCACHGSRFGKDGTRLNGPAMDHLSKKREEES